MRSNRRNMSKNFITKKLRKEYIMKYCNGLLALKWKNKQDVFIIFTKHEKVGRQSRRWFWPASSSRAPCLLVR